MQQRPQALAVGAARGPGLPAPSLLGLPRQDTHHMCQEGYLLGKQPECQWPACRFIA